MVNMSKTLALARKLSHVDERCLTPITSRVNNRQSSNQTSTAQQAYAYMIVIDFESTCWDKSAQSHDNEIIEFPAILVDTKTGETLSEFHHYVQPMEQPILSKFCTHLTGITQDVVDSSSPLNVILSKFKKWLNNLRAKHDLTYSAGDGKACAFVSWTNWDFGVCLPQECHRKGLIFPSQLSSWVDLKAVYKNYYKRQPKGLKASMLDVGLQFSGREHSGIIDCRNTVVLLLKIIGDGCEVELTKLSS